MSNTNKQEIEIIKLLKENEGIHIGRKKLGSYLWMYAFCIPTYEKTPIDKVASVVLEDIDSFSMFVHGVRATKYANRKKHSKSIEMLLELEQEYTMEI